MSEERDVRPVMEVTPRPAGVKIAELGRRPKLVDFDSPVTVKSLIEQGLIRGGMDYFVNGNLMSEDSLVRPGDVVVGVPRVRGA